MQQPVAKLLIGFFIVAVLLVAAAVIFTLSRPAPTHAPLPQPNGYDDFVKAGEMLADDASDYNAMSQEELRVFVKKNADALKLARAGLGRECRVPVDYSATIGTHLDHLAGIKRLALAFTAEGRLAEMENHPRDAAESYLSAVRLGHAVTRGGVMIDALVGLAAEAIGMARLENLTQTLDAKQCREVVSALETTEAGRESAEDILKGEHAWAWRSYGLKGQWIRLIMFKSTKQTEQRCVAKVTAQQTRTRRLLIQFAARAYELEKGDRPKRLPDLVPAYLKTIPQDPLTGTNMAYP